MEHGMLSFFFFTWKQVVRLYKAVIENCNTAVCANSDGGLKLEAFKVIVISAKYGDLQNQMLFKSQSLQSQ